MLFLFVMRTNVVFYNNNQMNYNSNNKNTYKHVELN